MPQIIPANVDAVTGRYITVIACLALVLGYMFAALTIPFDNRETS